VDTTDKKASKRYRVMRSKRNTRRCMNPSCGKIDKRAIRIVEDGPYPEPATILCAGCTRKIYGPIHISVLEDRLNRKI